MRNKFLWFSTAPVDMLQRDPVHVEGTQLTYMCAKSAQPISILLDMKNIDF